MPLRVMGYDGVAYRSQLNEERTDFYPVITLVLYFGTKSKWENHTSLKESLKIDERLKDFVSDYKIKVINLAWLTDEQINSFKSDFRIVAEYLRALRIGQAENWSRQKLKYVSEIIDLMRVISDDDIFDDMAEFIEDTQSKKGGVNVCEFVQKMKNEGRNEGVLLGRREGFSIGRNEERNNIFALFSKLYAEGRSADVERATKDKNYLNALMESENL